MNTVNSSAPIWTNRDNLAASEQGWNLFELNPKGDRHQIQKEDEMNTFVDDDHALAHVKSLAAAGNELATKALNMSIEFSPH
jgi:hypothetical protein